MRNYNRFKHPEEVSSADELDELEVVDDDEIFAIAMAANDEPDDGLSEHENPEDDPDYDVPGDENSESNSDFDADSSMSEDDENENVDANDTKNTNSDGPSSSKLTNNGQNVTCEDDDGEDDTIRAMIAAIKKPRSAPPEIKLEDFVTDICFHPTRHIIALATITGDVCLYLYDNNDNTLIRTIEVHAKSCRDVEFTEDGRYLLTCSKDKSIMVTDMTTEKLKKFYESAHDAAINKLYVIDENLFATGDDDGTVKLWDLRTKDDIFSLKIVEDYISQMLTNDDRKLLLATSGDGYLTTINIGARKLFVQSEPYEEELTCMNLYRGNSKLAVGTSKGRIYTYNWGQFGYHCDMFPGMKTNIGVMTAVTDRIGCIAGEEGIIRACHIAPFRNLGIVGQHSMPIECMDINTTGEIIATSSHNNDVCFWNIKYFEDFRDIKYNEKHNAQKEKTHNLPSSRLTNASDFFSDLANGQDGDESVDE